MLQLVRLMGDCSSFPLHQFFLLSRCILGLERKRSNLTFLDVSGIRVCSYGFPSCFPSVRILDAYFINVAADFAAFLDAD